MSYKPQTRLAAWLATCGASLVLAACGGGSSSQPDRTASQVQVGQSVNQTAFTDMAKTAACADISKQLYDIDGKNVVFVRKGNCADNASGIVLYGPTPDTVLCESGDTIAGPRTSCKDSSYKALFDTVLANLNQPDLGLGAAHKVQNFYTSLETDGKTDNGATFVKMASAASCGDKLRKVARIDGSLYFVGVEGSCADAAHAYWLYRDTPDNVACKAYDSIAGTQFDCADKSVADLFKTMVANVSLPYLGVDKGHRVEVLMDTSNFETLMYGSMGGITDMRTVVVRDQQSYEALWSEWAAQGDNVRVKGPAPVDFSKKMVIAYFRGWDRMQEPQELIKRVYRTDTGLVVVYAGPSKPSGDVEVAAVSAPFHFIVVDRDDGKSRVSFVEEGMHATLPVAWEQLASSSNSGIDKEYAEVVTTAKAWETLWQAHSARVMPAQPTPTVDFDKYMVLAVFNGPRPHGGYSLKIGPVYERGDTLWVEYNSFAPTMAEAMVSLYPAVITTHAQFVLVPKSNAKVQFFRHVEN